MPEEHHRNIPTQEFSRMVALQAVEKHWDESKLGAFPDVTLQWYSATNSVANALCHPRSLSCHRMSHPASTRRQSRWRKLLTIPVSCKTKGKNYLD
jgi:hypothetical protein